jgi:hypothetical protein
MGFFTKPWSKEILSKPFSDIYFSHQKRNSNIFVLISLKILSLSTMEWFFGNIRHSIPSKALIDKFEMSLTQWVCFNSFAMFF